jgi:hypothetical protein
MTTPKHTLIWLKSSKLKSNTQVLHFETQKPATLAGFLLVDQKCPICYNTLTKKQKEPTMKVKELIELLSKFNQESELRGSYNGGEYESVLDFLKVEEVDGKVWLLD